MAINEDGKARPIVAIGASTTGLLVLGLMNWLRDLPSPGVWIIAGFLSLVLGLAIRRAFDNRKIYIVRRLYQEDIDEYVTHDEGDAIVRASDLLTGLAKFVIDHPDAEDVILNSYTVTVTLPGAAAKRPNVFLQKLQSSLQPMYLAWAHQAVDRRGLSGSVVLDDHGRCQEIRLRVGSDS